MPKIEVYDINGKKVKEVELKMKYLELNQMKL